MPTLWDNLDLDSHSTLGFLPWSQPKSAAELSILSDHLQRERGYSIYAIVGDPKRVNPTARTPIREEALGTIGYLEINPQHRSVEIGAVAFGIALRQSAAATEAHYLLLCNVSEPKVSPPYRRIAWKNNHRDINSLRAAMRIGDSFDGT